MLPECTQVADRFHLLQNLVDRMKDLFQAELPKEIFISDGKILDTTPEKVKVLKVDPLSEDLDKYTYTNEAPMDENGDFITYDNKKRDLDSLQYKRQAENRKRKQQLIRSVQKRWLELGPKSAKQVATEFGINVVTVRKYIQMTEEDILLLEHPRNYKKRKTVMDDCLNIIYKMLADKIELAIILAYVIHVGYDGNIRTLQNYIQVIAKNNFNCTFHMDWAYKTEYSEGIIVIKRSQILSSIIQKDYWEEKDRDEVKKYIEIIKEHYEIIGLLEQAYNNFYKILMGKDAAQIISIPFSVRLISGYIEP